MRLWELASWQWMLLLQGGGHQREWQWMRLKSPVHGAEEQHLACW
jgi:hypothetical protein